MDNQNNPPMGNENQQPQVFEGDYGDDEYDDMAWIYEEIAAEQQANQNQGQEQPAPDALQANEPAPIEFEGEMFFLPPPGPVPEQNVNPPAQVQEANIPPPPNPDDYVWNPNTQAWELNLAANEAWWDDWDLMPHDGPPAW